MAQRHDDDEDGGGAPSTPTGPTPRRLPWPAQPADVVAVLIPGGGDIVILPTADLTGPPRRWRTPRGTEPLALHAARLRHPAAAPRSARVEGGGRGETGEAPGGTTRHLTQGFFQKISGWIRACLALS